MAEAATTDKTATTTTTAADTATADKTTGTTAAATTVSTATATTASTATTAAAKTDKGSATVTADKTTDATVTKGYWPDDWQKKLAGEDEKELKQVSRYQSPEDVWKKARALERRLSSGELKPALPKDAKPEEIAAWRKDNGIPEAPEKYDLKFDTGLVIGKEDQPIIADFLKTAHAKNYQPDQAKEAVQWYFKERERQAQERADKDENDRVAVLDTLNAEYGGQYRRNINLVEGVLSKFPESVREAIKAARLPDGMALFNHPDTLRGFVALALEVNPAGVVVPNGGGDLGKSMTDRYTDIQKFRRDNRADYNKDSKLQKEERDLISAMVKQGLMDDKGNLLGKKAA